MKNHETLPFANLLSVPGHLSECAERVGEAEPHPFAAALLGWYARNGRELPWRATRDPYRIWISEIILQQTRVAQGYDYYLRFMERFPDVETLASADADDVMHSWQGLGYYSRARNLHAAARKIAAAGCFPSDYESIRALPGVGDYTAAAIASFAFGLPRAVVDGNVYRVLARHFGISEPIDTTQGKRLFARLAQVLLPVDGSAAYNQAIMDFGALQCTPQSPRCEDCVLAGSCAALAASQVASLPVKSRKLPKTTRYLVYLYLRDLSQTDPHIYLHRRPAGDIWQGLYEPFVLEFDHHPAEEEVMQKAGFPEATWQCLRKGARHVLTHRILLADFYLLTFSAAPLCLPASYLRVPESSRSSYAVPRLVSICYEQVDGIV